MLNGKQIVHGDIRHLEILKNQLHPHNVVHGDIRHLEKIKKDRI